MAQQADPKQALEEMWSFVVPRVVRFQKRLILVASKLVPFLESFLKTLARAIKQVAKFAKDLAARIGKAAVSKLLALPNALRSILSAVKKSVQFGLKLAKNILSLVKSKLDPKRLLKTVRAQVAQFAKHFRLVWAKAKEMLSIINPIQAVFSIISSMQMVLRMVFNWITDLVQADKVLKIAVKAAKEVVKAMKSEMSELTKVVKQVNTLKLPA